MGMLATSTGKPVRELVSAEEWETRVDLAACYRLVEHFGMTEMVGNHISARVLGTRDEFLINPYGVFYDEITASCLVKVNLDGEILFNATGYEINRAGYVIHSAIHAGRPDAACVIHTHSIAGMAVSAMRCGLLPLAQTSMRFARIGYHDYEGVVLDLEERERLVRDLGDHEGMIMRNHGLLVLGASIPEAFNNIYRLERACQVQVAAVGAGNELVLPPDDVVEETWRLYQPDVRRRFGLLEWPGLLRRLDRLDPTFRD
jgi:ribulose-5-phosphate 4-epimerase/fuculose-1-phosphate aldolase